MRIRAQVIFRPRSDLGRFVEANIRPATVASVTETCERLQLLAKEYCPVDTGRLQESIALVVVQGKTVTGYVSPNTPYDEMVEFGTGQRGAASPGAATSFAGVDIKYNPSWPGMAAQPYMRPAADEVRPTIADTFRNNWGVAVKL